MKMICDPAVVGRRLRSIRKGLGFSGQKLADVAGLSAYTIFALELGRGLPNLYTVIRICEVLGITPNDLVCDDTDEMDG